MTVDQVLNDLRARHGPRLVFYAADLALLLGESEAATENLINSQSLPFSIKMVGNRRCVVTIQGVSLRETCMKSAAIWGT